MGNCFFRTSTWLGVLALCLLSANSHAQPTTWTPLPSPGGGWVNDLARTQDGIMCAFVGLSSPDLFCSHDDGHSWTLYPTPSHGRGRIVFSPTGTWYIAGSRLYRSVDQGASWNHLDTESIRYVLVDEQGHLYINGPTTNVFWISQDEGNTWESASTPGAELYRLVDGALYTTSSTTLYRRTSDGTWTPVVELPNMGPPLLHPNGTLFVTQRVDLFSSPSLPGGLFRVESDSSLTYVGFDNYLFDQMTVDDTGRLWIGLLSHCENHSCGPPAGLFSSSNLGTTWTTHNLEENPITALVPGEAESMYVGTGGFVSDATVFPAHGVLSLGANTSWTTLNKGIRKSTIFRLTQTQDGILYALADRTLARSDDSGLTWQTVYDLAANRILQRYRSIYAEALFTTAAGDVFAYIAPNVLLHSSDEGATWTVSQLPDEPTHLKVFGHSEAGTLFLSHTTRGLLRSTDNGQTWDVVGLGDDASSQYWTITQGPAGRLYGIASAVGSTTGTLYTSDDEGLSWTSIVTIDDAPAPAQLIAFSPTKLYLRFYTDSGSDIRTLSHIDGTWHLARLTTLDAHVNDMLVDPDGTLYVASNRGVARFSNNRWIALSSSFNAHVHTLTFDRQGYLFAGTHNDGLYKTGPLIATSIDRHGPFIHRLRSNYPNPFSEKTTIRFFLPEPTHTILTVYDALGRELEQLADQFLTFGYHEVSWQPTHAAAGVYYYRLEAGDTVDTGTMVRSRR